MILPGLSNWKGPIICNDTLKPFWKIFCPFREHTVNKKRTCENLYNLMA